MKSFQYLTILMVAIVANEAQLWNDQQWRRWEWMTFNTGYCEPYPWCFDRSEEANGGIFKDCDVDGEIGLTWDELKHCEEIYSAGDPENRPTEQDFDEFDVNKDSVVTFDELIEIFDKEIKITNHAAHLE